MKKIISTLLIIISIQNVSNAQMSAGFFSVTASNNYTPTGTKAWATNFNGLYGMITNLMPNELTQGLQFNGFGFNIPAASQIVGVQAILTYSVLPITSGISILKDSIVQLMVNNLPVGNNLGGVHNFTTVVTTFTYGDPVSTWGATLTPAAVNATNFGFVSNLKSIGTAVSQVGVEKTQLQSAKMKIYYVSTTGVIESQTAVAKSFSYNNILNVNDADANTLIEIYTIEGKKVKEAVIERNEEKIDLSYLKPGLYIYQYTQNKEKVSGKFIIN